MDHTKFLATLRAVRNEAARWGYCGDVLAAADTVPLVGTLGQQLVMATIGADVRPRPATTRDRELVNRLIRAAVLLSPAADATDAPPPADAVERATRHAVADRRRQQRRGRR